jgi:hypothetical protein
MSDLVRGDVRLAWDAEHGLFRVGLDAEVQSGAAEAVAELTPDELRWLCYTAGPAMLARHDPRTVVSGRGRPDPSDTSPPTEPPPDDAQGTLLPA